MGASLQTIATTVAGQFSDLNDIAGATRLLLRLLLAAVLGGVLGWEREARGKAAGMRTHMLVCVGAALFVLVPLEVGVSDDAMTRVIQGLVTGIGFLGAGTIIKGQDAGRVRGLTTAASVWMTAAIGLAAGWGRGATAVASTLGALAVLYLLPHVEERGTRRGLRSRARANSPPPGTPPAA